MGHGSEPPSEQQPDVDQPAPATEAFSTRPRDLANTRAGAMMTSDSGGGGGGGGDLQVERNKRSTDEEKEDEEDNDNDNDDSRARRSLRQEQEQEHPQSSPAAATPPPPFKSPSTPPFFAPPPSSPLPVPSPQRPRSTFSNTLIPAASSSSTASFLSKGSSTSTSTTRSPSVASFFVSPPLHHRPPPRSPKPTFFDASPIFPDLPFRSRSAANIVHRRPSESQGSYFPFSIERELYNTKPRTPIPAVLLADPDAPRVHSFGPNSRTEHANPFTQIPPPIMLRPAAITKLLAKLTRPSARETPPPLGLHTAALVMMRGGEVYAYDSQYDARLRLMEDAVGGGEEGEGEGEGVGEGEGKGKGKGKARAGVVADSPGRTAGKGKDGEKKDTPRVGQGLMFSQPIGGSRPSSSLLGQERVRVLAAVASQAWKEEMAEVGARLAAADGVGIGEGEGAAPTAGGGAPARTAMMPADFRGQTGVRIERGRAKGLIVPLLIECELGRILVLPVLPPQRPAPVSAPVSAAPRSSSSNASTPHPTPPPSRPGSQAPSRRGTPSASPSRAPVGDSPASASAGAGARTQGSASMEGRLGTLAAPNPFMILVLNSDEKTEWGVLHAKARALLAHLAPSLTALSHLFEPSPSTAVPRFSSRLSVGTASTVVSPERSERSERTRWANEDGRGRR